MTSLAAPITPVPPDAAGVPGAQARPAAAPARLRIVVVDDHPLYREGIVRALEGAGMDVVAQGGDGESAIGLIREHLPDVALLDVSMPGTDGIDVVAVLAREGLAVPVVLLSAFGDEALVLSGLQAGAATYIGKSADRAAIVEAVADAADPGKSPRALVGPGDLVPGGRRRWIPHLTLQEYRLLQLAREGLTKPEMAQRLGIDEPSVRRGLSRAIAKIGAVTLGEALDVAVRTGVLR